MIPLEKQVTSLELSRRLKKLWVKQDSLFYWIQGGPYTDDWSESTIESERQVKQYNKDFICSAFTVAELGMALPRNTKSYRDTDFKTEFWVCEQLFNNRVFADTEANARDKMRIWLIENKAVKEE